MLFLGVDGGATKTVAVIINESYKVIHKAIGKEANHHAIGVNGVEKNLYQLLSFVKKKKLNISYACFGLAGINSIRDHKLVFSALKKRIGKLLNCPMILLNDTRIILPGINAENGVAVIGGTGCNFYAKNGKKEASASGLDYILADEGSAYDIGLMVLRAAVRSSDSRGDKTVLEKLVLRKSRTRNIRGLGNVIYKNPGKSEIASYAPLAEKAALRGDKVAKQILSAAANEYVIGIKAVSKKTGLRKFDVALVGSVFRAKSVLREIKKGVSSFAKARFFIIKDPSIGAAKLAMKISQT